MVTNIPSGVISPEMFSVAKGRLPMLRATLMAVLPLCKNQNAQAADDLLAQPLRDVDERVAFLDGAHQGEAGAGMGFEQDVLETGQRVVEVARMRAGHVDKAKFADVPSVLAAEFFPGRRRAFPRRARFTTQRCEKRTGVFERRAFGMNREAVLDAERIADLEWVGKAALFMHCQIDDAEIVPGDRRIIGTVGTEPPASTTAAIRHS